MEEARRAEQAEARRRAQEVDAAKKRADEEAARLAEAERRRAELEELRKQGGEVYKVEEGAVGDLAEGFAGLTTPVFDEVSAKLSELQAAQTALVELLAQEDRKVMTLPNMAEVAQALSHVPLYTQRLLEMRQEMDAITQRVKGMRKRAARVYSKKQQEDNLLAAQRQASLQEQQRVLEGGAGGGK